MASLSAALVGSDDDSDADDTAEARPRRTLSIMQPAPSPLHYGGEDTADADFLLVVHNALEMRDLMTSYAKTRFENARARRVALEMVDLGGAWRLRTEQGDQFPERVFMVAVLRTWLGPLALGDFARANQGTGYWKERVNIMIATEVDLWASMGIGVPDTMPPPLLAAVVYKTAVSIGAEVPDAVAEELRNLNPEGGLRRNFMYSAALLGGVRALGVLDPTLKRVLGDPGFVGYQTLVEALGTYADASDPGSLERHTRLLRDVFKAAAAFGDIVRIRAPDEPAGGGAAI